MFRHFRHFDERPTSGHPWLPSRLERFCNALIHACTGFVDEDNLANAVVVAIRTAAGTAFREGTISNEFGEMRLAQKRMTTEN